MTLLIPFARRRSDGRMVDALTVPKGKSCNCECPNCGNLVIARHCTLKTAHFAHAVSATCSGALESSLHSAAKQVIVELGFVWLPESLAGERMKFVFARAETETKRDEVRPDLVLYTKGGKPLAIEIFVTHAITAAKEEYLRKAKLACVEYHLDSVPREITYLELKRMFAEDHVFGTWAYNEKAAVVAAERAKQMVRRMKKEEMEQRSLERRQQMELQTWLRSPHAKPRTLVVREISGRRYILMCPIRRRGAVENFKGIAFADIDCPKCAYCVGRSSPPSTPVHVECIGHFPKLALQDDALVRRFGGKPTRHDVRSSTSQLANSPIREPDPF